MIDIGTLGSVQALEYEHQTKEELTENKALGCVLMSELRVHGI